MNGMCNRESSDLNPSDARVSVIGSYASERNLLDMPVIAATAAAEHREVSELKAQRVIAPAEIGRIADVEIRCRVELRMTARRCIRPQAAQACGPSFPLPQRIGEMRGMGAIEHVVCGRIAGLAVGLLDC